LADDLKKILSSLLPGVKTYLVAWRSLGAYRPPHFRLVFAWGAGAGLTLALVLMASIREELEVADVPAVARGNAWYSSSPGSSRGR